MNRRPRLLDAFCGEGGAGMGYHRAGFDVVGVDLDARALRRYPFPSVRADAVWFIREHGHEFDAIHTSPPCQAFSLAQRIRGNAHPDLIGPSRNALIATGRPWIIENVPGAPLHRPVELCGCMFPSLAGVYRERWFEASIPLPRLLHAEHVEPLTKMGRPPKPGERMHVVGNFSGTAEARRRMDISWMTRDGLRESIPPAYGEWLGGQLIDQMRAVA